jgi:hypothetical protein
VLVKTNKNKSKLTLILANHNLAAFTSGNIANLACHALYVWYGNVLLMSGGQNACVRFLTDTVV